MEKMGITEAFFSRLWEREGRREREDGRGSRKVGEKEKKKMTGGIKESHYP